MLSSARRRAAFSVSSSLRNLALRIGQRRRYRVPAIENDRSVGAGVAIAPARPAAGLGPLVGPFAAAAPEMLFSITIAHGRLVSRVPLLWQFEPLAARIDASRWLTLPWRFPHKPPDREFAIGARF